MNSPINGILPKSANKADIKTKMNIINPRENEVKIKGCQCFGVDQLLRSRN